jgi:hypothetical protein
LTRCPDPLRASDTNLRCKRNPAVLGYIFEKYINQREFGAYYTRPEITEYLCEQTIHKLVLDAANKHVAGQQLLVRHGLKKDGATAEFESIGDVLLRADASLCRELLHTTLPQLSILDPAVGSGAFLVAAPKTLLAIYTGLLGRAEAVQEKAVLQWIETEREKHNAPVIVRDGTSSRQLNAQEAAAYISHHWPNAS